MLGAVGAGAGVQLRDDLAGRGEQDRVDAGSTIGRPRLEREISRGRQVADVYPSVIEIEPERFGITGA